MNIDELLKDSKTVDFVLDGGKGKRGTVKMQSPSAATAREVSEQFFQHGKQLAAAQAAQDAGRDYDGAPIPIGMEVCQAAAVRACIAPNDPLANMDEDQSRAFIRRIGGLESDVVKYALTVLGITTFDNEDVEGDHSDF